MAIKVNPEQLRSTSATITGLKDQVSQINDCLLESVGNAADIEKKIISTLSQICTVTIPDMLDSSSRLLNTIAAEFEKTDNKYSGKPEQKEPLSYFTGHFTPYE